MSKKSLKSNEKLKKLRSMESYEASKSAEQKNKRRRRILKKSSENYGISNELSENDWIGSFKTLRRAKRSVKTVDNYSLKTSYDKWVYQFQ